MTARFALALLLATSVHADEVEQRLRARLASSERLMQRLVKLTDGTGPRLTGSLALTEAHRYCAGEFQRMGLAVALEPFDLPVSWTRGPASARLLRPSEQELPVAQVGWTPATPGPIEGRLVSFAPRDASQKAAFAGKLSGAIVLLGEPATDLEPLMMEPPLRLQRPPKTVAEAAEPTAEWLAFLQAEGAAAYLCDSGKPPGLFNMEARAEAAFRRRSLLPGAFVTHEQYLQLFRLAAREAVARLSLEGRLGPAAEVLNTRAELRGREAPDEIVLVAAHLDSWDLATGATDDAAGVAAVMEAAALLSESGARPRRSIRFALFSGEEQGLLGARAYVARHREELARHSAAFVMDTGSGRIDGIALQGRAEVEPTLRRVLEPLRALGVVENDLRREGGTDHLPLDAAGVPAFVVEQVQYDYSRNHHSQSDTLDKVHPEDLQQAAVVLALLAYRVAELPDQLPRR